jgi:hypothetical protein
VAGARPGGAPTKPAVRRQRPALPVVLAGGAVLVVALIVAVVLIGGGGGGGGESTPPATNTIQTTPSAGSGSSGAGGSAPAALKPSQFTTVVLNGTTVGGLARGVDNRLKNQGFKTGTPANAVDQSRSATIVEYADGHRREGLLVAGAVDVKADAVQKMTAGTRSIAGDTATVVVTVGIDQTKSPQQ